RLTQSSPAIPPSPSSPSPHATRPTLPPHSFPTRRSSDLPPSETISSPCRSPASAAGDPDCTLAITAPPPELSVPPPGAVPTARRSEEHTSELQSRGHLVCRLLLEKKKDKKSTLIRSTSTQ